MILITGANGLVGSQICTYLHTKGEKIKALVREGADLSLLKDLPEDSIVTGDILDPWSLESAMEGVNCVIHSAAMVSFAKKEAEQMNKINIEGTSNIVNKCLENDIESLIYISSISAIPINSFTDTPNESAKWPGNINATRYGTSKYLGELEVWRGAAEGLPVLVLAPSTVMGPGNWQRSSSQLFKYVWDQNPFYTTGTLNYIDVRDFCDVLYKLMEKRVTNEKFIVNGGSITYKKFFSLIGSALDKKAPSIKATALLVKFAIALAWLKSLFSGKPPLVTSETAVRGKSNVFYDNSKLIKTLNYEFRTINESINWVSDILKKQLSK